MEEKNYITGALTLLCIILGIAFFTYQKPSQAVETVQIEQPCLPAIQVENEEKKQEERKIKVHVCGEVAIAGVYELPMESLVYDAIACAGGFKHNADITRINLARQLRNQEQICIRKVDNGAEKPYYICAADHKQTQTPNTSEPLQTMQTQVRTAVNINTAGVEELAYIPGIGGKTAEKILNYRNTYGQFRDISEIENIPGIRKNILAKCRSYMTVE